MYCVAEYSGTSYSYKFRTTCLPAIIGLYYLIVIHDSVPAEVWTGHQRNASHNRYKLRQQSLATYSNCWTTLTVVYVLFIYCFLLALQPTSGAGPLHSRDLSITHTPQSVGLLWTSDQRVAEISLWQNTIDIRVIRTHTFSRRAAADLGLGPLGHWDRHMFGYTLYFHMLPCSTEDGNKPVFQKYMSNRYCYLPLLRQVAVTVWQIPDAVDTVVFAPDDGWRYHPKHVEVFQDINKLCNFASCWIYIGIYLRRTDPWTLK